MSSLTKRTIKDTFVTLLENKPFSAITVKLIVEECGINRNSFYYYYHDIPDLIEEIVREESDRIIAEYSKVNTIEEALLAVMEFTSAHRKAILHIYNSVNRDIFERYLWKVCDYIVSAFGVSALNGREIDKLDREIIHRYYMCECFGSAIEWLNSRMQAEPREYIKRFCELFAGVTEEIIQRSLTDRK